VPGSGIKTRLLLYGAYGYTGRLTAELAAAKKLDVNPDGPVPDLHVIEIDLCRMN